MTLRGTVLPIGGLKEKLLAAGRGGIRTVLIPKENEKDLAEIPKEIRAGITVHPVAHMDEVLGYALLAPVGLAPAALYGDAAVAVAENSVVPH